MAIGLTTLLPAAAEATTEAAARCLRAGGLVAFPTETVYGLGADAGNAGAIARLYQAKGRPSFNPLIAHVSDLAAARGIADFNAQAILLAQTFWPGPLTLVLPKAVGCPVADLATAGLNTIAVRVPAHPIARDILRAFGGPVVAPSANVSGHVSPTTAEHVRSDLADRIDLIVDGGPVEVGVESTIVGCFETPMLLRPGGLPRGEIERVLGRALLQPPPDAGAGSSQPLAPGMLASHYAPRAKLRLNADRLEAGEALLAFGPDRISGTDASFVMNLSERGDLAEAAARPQQHRRLKAADDGGFDADLDRSAIDDQVDAVCKVAPHMFGRGRRDVPGEVGRGRHHGSAEGAQDVARYRVGGNPDRDGVETRGGEIGHRAADRLRQHQR